MENDRRVAKIIKITYIHYLIFLNGVLSEEVQPANML